MERVSPLLGSNSRVSCSMWPPSSRISIWRRASCSIAWPMKRIELTFLISQRVPSGAPVSLFHVAVAGAEIAHDGAQLRDIGLGVLGRAQIRFRHDLHERDAGAIEVDEGHAGMPVVQRFSGVLFEMQPLDPDGHGFAVGQIDDDLALAHERRLVLA